MVRSGFLCSKFITHSLFCSYDYSETSNISRMKFANLNVYRLVMPLSLCPLGTIEARCSVENEDVVGAAPTGDAPTTSE